MLLRQTQLFQGRQPRLAAHILIWDWAWHMALKRSAPAVDGQTVTETILPKTDPLKAGRGWTVRRPSHRVGIVAVIAVLFVVAGGGYKLTHTSTSAPVQPQRPGVARQVAVPATPSALLNRAMADAEAEKSVHIDSQDVTPGHAVSDSDDDAVTSGIQRIHADGGHVEARVVGPTTYFSADYRGFVKVLGFTSAQAKQLRGQWLALTKGQPGYAAVTTGITLSSALQELKLTAPLKQLSARTKDGQRVIGIQGRPVGHGVPANAHATVWITEGSHPLPVEYDASSGHATMTATLSNWGRTVNVQAPVQVYNAPGLSG